MSKTNCRFCGTSLTHTFCDLGMSPLSNAYLKEEDLLKHEASYPLHAYVCAKCFLVQLEQFETPAQIFSDYAYFSSYSDSWLKHAENYVQEMMQRFKFNSSNQVIEIASNDGYLLRYFKEKGIPVLGIEPAANVADVAQAAGIPTQIKFFSVQTAKELLKEKKQADLLIGNNVLAHVPDLNDFVAGMKLVLKPQGIITMEFPHLWRLMVEHQFDTIYHEHFSYFSFITVENLFKKHGLSLFDVQELSTHGGSLRIFAKHQEDHSKEITRNVTELKQREISFGLDKLETYQAFQKNVTQTKESLLKFFTETKKQGKTVVGYGAPAKGNTLLNFCGVGRESIDYTVDRSPHKQGRFLPGTHIAIKTPDEISKTKPDYLLILPWNLKDEIMQQMAYINSWGGKFVIPIPYTKILN